MSVNNDGSSLLHEESIGDSYLIHCLHLLYLPALINHRFTLQQKRYIFGCNATSLFKNQVFDDQTVYCDNFQSKNDFCDQLEQLPFLNYTPFEQKFFQKNCGCLHVFIDVGSFFRKWFKSSTQSVLTIFFPSKLSLNFENVNFQYPDRHALKI